ncbi:MAG: BrnT family toxin [Hydrogenophaga sp.]|nr:BrnT family toxin [Hydrogenophaga sp.]
MNSIDGDRTASTTCRSLRLPYIVRTVHASPSCTSSGIPSIVAHCYRAEGDAIRIISARKATREEQAELDIRIAPSC